LGFKNFELMTTFPHCWPRGWSAADRVEFQKLYESLGMHLTSLNPTFLDLNMASPNPGIREETITQLRETIQLAHDVGAEMVVVSAGKKHPLIAPDFSYFWDLVRGGIESLLPDCERLGVTFCLENGWTVVTKAEQMVRMARELPHPRMKLSYDVANATMVESALEGLELVANDMILLHISDTDDKNWGHDRIGTGVIDFTAVTEKVREIGYTGPTTLEIVDRNEPDESNRISLARMKALGWSV
jgi:sugar phosphate isomerase/epimerase